MRGRDAVGLAAVARRIVRQVEERADFLDRDTQLARMAHEAETRQVRARIAAIVGGGTIGRGGQADELGRATRGDREDKYVSRYESSEESKKNNKRHQID